MNDTQPIPGIDCLVVDNTVSILYYEQLVWEYSALKRFLCSEPWVVWASPFRRAALEAIRTICRWNWQLRCHNRPWARIHTADSSLPVAVSPAFVAGGCNALDMLMLPWTLLTNINTEIWVQNGKRNGETFNQWSSLSTSNRRNDRPLTYEYYQKHPETFLRQHEHLWAVMFVKKTVVLMF